MCQGSREYQHRQWKSRGGLHSLHRRLADAKVVFQAATSGNEGDQLSSCGLGTWSFATAFCAPMKNASFTRGSNWMVCSGLVVFAPNSSSRLPNDLGCRERLVLSFLLVFGCIEVTCQCEGRSGAMQISRKEWTMPPKIDPFLLAEEHLQIVRTCSSLWRLSYNDALFFCSFCISSKIANTWTLQTLVTFDTSAGKLMPAICRLPSSHPSSHPSWFKSTNIEIMIETAWFNLWQKNNCMRKTWKDYRHAKNKQSWRERTDLPGKNGGWRWGLIVLPFLHKPRFCPDLALTRIFSPPDSDISWGQVKRH